MKKEKGSILILVLWTLGLLSVFALYLGIGIRQRLDFLKRIETRNKLYLIAEAGVKKAVTQLGNFENENMVISLNNEFINNRNIFFQSPIGDGNFTVGYPYKKGDLSKDENQGDSEGMIYGIADAGRRLNINTASREEIIRLIEYSAGVEQGYADKIASAIIDWRDEDNKSLPNGAESSYYQKLPFPYDSKDGKFESLEELTYVKGMNAEIFDSIKPYITVFGGGQVNINTAYGPTLYALGLSEEIVEKILLYRCGEDNIIFTKDDRVFTSASSIVAQLSHVYSMPPSEVAQLSNTVAQNKFSVSSEVFLIKSLASLNYTNEKCTVECVIEKNPDPESINAGRILSFMSRYTI